DRNSPTVSIADFKADSVPPRTLTVAPRPEARRGRARGHTADPHAGGGRGPPPRRCGRTLPPDRPARGPRRADDPGRLPPPPARVRAGRPPPRPARPRLRSRPRRGSDSNGEKNNDLQTPMM